MKILIGIPCMDTLPVGFVESLMHMDMPAETSVCFKKNSLIYDSRNLLSLRAMEEKYDWVLWLDSDMVVPRDALKRLLNVAKTECVDMVTGLYVKRTFPPEPVLFSHVEPPSVDPEDGRLTRHIYPYIYYPDDSVFPVGGCGFGCVLTSVPLLRDVWDKFGPAFAPFAWAGEDISFCHRVNLLGRKILCDSGVNCGHIGTLVYTDKLCNARRGGDDTGEKH